MNQSNASLGLAVIAILFGFMSSAYAYDSVGRGDFVKRIQYICSSDPRKPMEITFYTNRTVSSAIDGANYVCSIGGSEAVIKKVHLFSGY